LANPQAVRRLRKEIEAVAQLSHPNIVVAHDAAQIGESYFLVMEYVEGWDLRRLVLERGRLPVNQACAYTRQAALGLQHAHERGLVHRDIKPSNLLVAVPGEVVKITDFGLARLQRPGDVQPATDSTASDLTDEGMVIGTPDFIAPEQALDSHTVDIRADVYSLGCTLYYLLSGQVPFPGGTLMQKLHRHQQATPAEIQSLRQDLPPGLPQVLRKMMAKQPGERYGEPASVAAVLAPYCSAERGGPEALAPAAEARSGDRTSPGPRESHRPEPEAPATAAERLRILLVEEGSLQRLVALRLLEREGYAVVVAGSATEALTVVGEQPFDLILIQGHVPGMDAGDFMAAIRQQGLHLPVLAMTTDPECRTRCLEAGMVGCVSRPIRGYELPGIAGAGRRV
jgi:CheY-like chemotaxis protein